MTRRIGKLDTPEKCTEECAHVYREARKGEVTWLDAQGAAAVIQRLWTMLGGHVGEDTLADAANGEAKWKNVGKNALHR